MDNLMLVWSRLTFPQRERLTLVLSFYDYRIRDKPELDRLLLLPRNDALKWMIRYNNIAPRNEREDLEIIMKLRGKNG